MRVEKIKNRFSKLIEDYLAGEQSLKELYQFAPTLEGLEKSLKLRQFTIEKRKVLSTALQKQYENVETSELTSQNIKLLEHTTTYTVTTGHQLALATGPLFFIYKIISTIKLTQLLRQQFPLYNFVPVFWMASEDHDFEEINHFHLFGNKYAWESKQKGAVGRMKLDGVMDVFEGLNDFPEQFKNIYANSKNLSEATFRLANELFKKYGLVIIEPDISNLKALFSPIIKDEILNQSSLSSISATSNKISELGYKVQVNSREINFFYLEDGIRERIVFEDNKYKVLNTKLSFSQDEIISLIESNPEKFSPNVVMRPVYQEYILPNLAYIGGPGELAYWLQLKENFDRLGVYFPNLLLRDSFLIINKGNKKVMDKLELHLTDLFKDVSVLRKDLVKKWSDSELNLNDELSQIETVIQSIRNKTDDKSLYPAIEAEFAKVSKSLTNLEKRMVKAEERKHETSLTQLEKMMDKLFPDGVPQERHENVLNYLINNPNFIDEVFEHSEVLDNQLKVLLPS